MKITQVPLTQCNAGPLLTTLQLNIYPIKSLRGISLPSATLCAQGLAYDRRYILLKPLADGKYKSMFVGNMPEMALFHPTLAPSPEDPWTHFTVDYRPPNPVSSSKEPLQIPFSPEIKRIPRIHHARRYK
jgi:hypothetical protein